MNFLLCVGLFHVTQSSLVQSATINTKREIAGDINYDIVKKHDSNFAPPSGPGVFLTPLIANGLYKRAQHAAMVVPDILGVQSYSGYLTVNAELRNHLFFWFFPAQNSKWMDLPLVLWLQGGPGGSSLYGLFEELGPFETDGMYLKKRKFSWNRNVNLLFIDQPVGTGFSFSETNFLHDNGTAAGKDLYNAVVQFHQLFPNFQRNKFFIAGESYAGHYIPVLGHIIHNYNPISKVKINLAGMMLGNPWSDPIIQNDYGAYLYNAGLLDKAQEDELQNLYEKFVKYAKEGDWSNASDLMNYDIWNNIDDYIRDVDSYNILRLKQKISDVFVPFLENNRLLLHVGPYKYEEFNDQVFTALEFDSVHSVKPLIEELLDHYPMVFYSGQLDIICAYPMTATLLRSLNWTGHDLFQKADRTKWCIRGEQVGYMKQAGNLYEVMIRNAGHMVPKDQPEAAFDLLQSVITAPDTGNLLYALDVCPPMN